MTRINLIPVEELHNIYLKENKMNYESKIKELETKLEELKELLKEEESKKNWPQIGGKYWYISAATGVSHNPFEDDDVDKLNKEIGNFFRTEEEAVSEMETRKVFQELREQQGRVNEFVAESNNCSIAVMENNTVSPDYWISRKQCCMLGIYDSEESVRQAIQVVGEERIIKAVNWFIQRKVW